MGDRYNYSSLSRVEGERNKVKIIFSNIIDSEPDLIVEVELLGMFEPNSILQAMNLGTLICLNEDMILHYLNKFGSADKVQNETR